MAKKVNEQAVIELIINGEKSKTTIKEVRTTMIGLERQLLNMKKADDPAGYEKLRKQLEKVRAAHQSMINEVRGGEGSLKQLKTNWKDIAAGFVGGNVALQAVSMLKASLFSLVTTNAELSDSLADVKKQTGLADAELNGLNDDLKKIKTRTTTEELRGLAEIAGKLGYESRDDVLEFVKAADKLNVALAKDLGGNVEEAINDIGKLVEIYDLEDEFGIEKALLKVGSAINTVGASSQANEGYLVNWSKRFAGIAPNAGISIADTIGLAAAADVLGQSAELSATNMGKMIIGIGKDIPYFAKVARMSVKEFSDLLQTDGNEAFLRVLEGAKNTTKGVEGLAKMLKVLNIEGSEGAAVLGAMVKNIDLVREQQDIANASFEKGNSVLEEFNTKNQNSAAILDRVSKVISNWWEGLSSKLNPAITLFGRLFGVVDDLEIKSGEFAAQQEKVLSLESKVPPLIKRYEELKKQTSLSKDEQAEMKIVIDQLAEVLPNSVTKFDKYGNAIEISTGKARDAIEVQRQLLKVLNKDAVKEVDEQIKTVQRTLASNQKLLDDTSGSLEYQGRKGYVRVPRSEESTRRLIGNIKAANAELDSLAKKRKELLGEFEPAAAPKTKKTGGNNETQTDFVGLSGDDAKKIVSEREKLHDDLLKNQQQLTLALMKEQEKELFAAQIKYDTLRQRAKRNADDLKTINEQHQQEVQAISDKYNQKHLADFDKVMRAQLGNINAAKKEEFEYQQSRQDDAAKRLDKELFEINDHYQKEIALAKSRNESIVQLEKDWQREVDELKAGRALKSQQDFMDGVFDSYRSELAIAEENGVGKEAIVRSHLERLRIMREQFGEMDLEDQRRLNSEIAKADRELLAVKLENIQKTGQAMQGGSQVISDILTLASNNQGEYAEFQKALGLFQIAVDTGTAIASAVATSTKGDPYTTAARIIAAVASVTAGMVKAQQLINSVPQPETPAYRADGGPTDLNSIMVDKSGSPEGWVSRPTLFSLGRRSYVAGEAGKEYVISNPMLQNPVVADFANMLEAMRQQRFFASGGSTQLSAPAPQPSLDQRAALEMIGLLREIAVKPQGFNYNLFEKYQELIDKTRLRASA